MLKRAVATLAVEIQRPVYYLISEYALLEARGSFFRPPNPGMIAWCVCHLFLEATLDQYSNL